MHGEKNSGERTSRRKAPTGRRGSTLALAALLASPFLFLLATPAAAQASFDVFVSSFTTGAVYKVDSVSGVTSPVASLGYMIEDGVIDYNGMSYWGGITTGVKRVNTLTNAILPDVGTNICGPEGGSVDAAGNIYFNTRDFPCPASGVWKIAGGTTASATQVVPYFSFWGEGTTILTSGPFAGHLLSSDSAGGRIVRSSPADLAANNPPTNFITGLGIVGDVKQDSLGRIYVSIVNPPGTIRRYTSSGAFIDIFATGLSSPIFMEFDSLDNLYVAEHLLGFGVGQWGGLVKILPSGSKTILAHIPYIVGVAIRPGTVVPVDIKPQSCPNPLNVGNKGVLPVAILGTASFDVSWVDPASVKLEGVSALRWAREDVATPYVPYLGKDSADDCTDAGPDGYADLTLKFDTQAIVAALGPVDDGDVLVLQLTGNLLLAFQGTPILGEDVVVIVKK